MRIERLVAGRIAEDAGQPPWPSTLHGRAAPLRNGRPSPGRRAHEALTTVPVLGNSDIWTVDGAVRMMRETGCDGVVIGRGARASAGWADTIVSRLVTGGFTGRVGTVTAADSSVPIGPAGPTVLVGEDEVETAVVDLAR